MSPHGIFEFIEGMLECQISESETLRRKEAGASQRSWIPVCGPRRTPLYDIPEASTQRLASESREFESHRGSSVFFLRIDLIINKIVPL